MDENQRKGFGCEVPPLQKHVVIWFSHNGADVSIALNFYSLYESIQWKNSRGNIIGNWKVHAWKWLWDK
ncbi:hypothetical protein [Pedobacter miscanthi]|jgi:hypothetical protein|uniref:hypothetical protein n=1 Tax=Pedobacter miscanthi TaxID=2259170 RepID=UPI00292E0401|nr:hypothetical protein [Pedobacter miscanthi]